MSKLVVKHTHKSDAVSEDLEAGDNGAPDEDGCADKENILQYTTEGQDEAGGFANLEIKLAQQHKKAGFRNLPRKPLIRSTGMHKMRFRRRSIIQQRISRTS